MKNLLAVICILLISLSASAQTTYPRDITLCWNHPTLYTDGSDIQPGDLSDTRLTIDRHDGTRIVDALIAVVGLPGERQCSNLTGDVPKPGTYTSFAYAITIDDTSSDASNASVKKYTGKPNPDENLVAQ